MRHRKLNAKKAKKNIICVYASRATNIWDSFGYTVDWQANKTGDRGYQWEGVPRSLAMCETRGQPFLSVCVVDS
jgi:hypothetical protein